jgi:transcriptional regulator with XRE-family HTH domain
VIGAVGEQRVTMRRLDSRSLFAALDQQRTVRGLTWNALARETGVSVTTIKRIERGQRMEVDGLLALVGWLGVPVETFVRDVDG